MTPDTSGRELPEPLAIYDRGSRSWRTFGGMFPSDSMPSLATLPTWGMTLAGALYPLPEPALPTVEPASSSQLPTPRATRGGSSTETVPLLPTPMTSEANGVGEHGTGGPDLRTAVHLMGTPRSVLWKAGTMQASREAVARRGHKHRLEQDIALLPTPTASDSTGSRNSTHQRPLGSTANVGDTLTDAATVLTGGRTRALSAAGKASPEEPLPDLLSLLLEEESGWLPTSLSG
jgi:hypothetical protein